jgi:Cys-rich repeat protein
VQRRTNCELSGQVCDDATASCVEPACPLTEADCPFSIPLLDPIACACVACLSNGDCGSGQSCSDGTCVGGGGGASDCTNDTQCEEAAIALGGTGTGAACDLDTNSCFTLSTCNGAAGGTDIFNADCPSGTTCQPNPLVGSKCAGCTSSSQCRTGETCYDCATTTVCSDASGLGPLGAFFCTPL